MKRIQCSTITETLITASEHCADAENILILMWNKPGSELAGQSFSDKDLTVAQCLLMIEQFRFWMMNNTTKALPSEEDE
jgi:hypothetical protein